MCKEHIIAQQTIKEFLEKGNDFTYTELQQKIVDSGGILRISPTYTVGEFIMEKEEEGLLNFNRETKKFQIKHV